MKYIIFYQILISSQLLNALSQWDVVYKHLTQGKYADVSRIGPFFIIWYLKQTHILETRVSSIFGANSSRGDILEMDNIGNCSFNPSPRLSTCIISSSIVLVNDCRAVPRYSIIKIFALLRVTSRKSSLYHGAVLSCWNLALC